MANNDRRLFVTQGCFEMTLCFSDKLPEEKFNAYKAEFEDVSENWATNRSKATGTSASEEDLKAGGFRKTGCNFFGYAKPDSKDVVTALFQSCACAEQYAHFKATKDTEGVVTVNKGAVIKSAVSMDSAKFCVSEAIRLGPAWIQGVLDRVDNPAPEA